MLSVCVATGKHLKGNKVLPQNILGRCSIHDQCRPVLLSTFHSSSTLLEILFPKPPPHILLSPWPAAKKWCGRAIKKPEPRIPGSGLIVCMYHRLWMKWTTFQQPIIFGSLLADFRPAHSWYSPKGSWFLGTRLHFLTCGNVQYYNN